MEQDFTQAMREIDALQERLDDLFKRVNADPLYRDEQTLRDAISDNPRYFDEDRKKDMAEIFYAVLDQIYERILHQEKETLFCNPQCPSERGERLPELEMLMRDLMPLGWALSAAWEFPELADRTDAYIASYSDAELQLFYEILTFLFNLFPEYKNLPAWRDVSAYWRKLALERETLSPESDELKSRLLTRLLEKRAAMKR